MTDICDRAQALEERQRDAAINRVRDSVKVHGVDVTCCMTCGDEIEEARRLAMPGTTRCAVCQREAERSTRWSR